MMDRMEKVRSVSSVLTGCTIQTSASLASCEFDTLFLFRDFQLRFCLRWMSYGLREGWSVTKAQPMWGVADLPYYELDLDAMVGPELGLGPLEVELWRANFGRAVEGILPRARAAAEAAQTDQGEAWSRYAEFIRDFQSAV